MNGSYEKWDDKIWELDNYKGNAKGFKANMNELNRQLYISHEITDTVKTDENPKSLPNLLKDYYNKRGNSLKDFIGIIRKEWNLKTDQEVADIFGISKKAVNDISNDNHDYKITFIPAKISQKHFGEKYNQHVFLCFAGDNSKSADDIINLYKTKIPYAEDEAEGRKLKGNLLKDLVTWAGVPMEMIKEQNNSSTELWKYFEGEHLPIKSKTAEVVEVLPFLTAQQKQSVTLLLNGLAKSNSVEELLNRPFIKKADFLEELRASKSMTQKQFAEHIGISLRNYMKILDGSNPKIATVITMSQNLQVPKHLSKKFIEFMNTESREQKRKPYAQFMDFLNQAFESGDVRLEDIRDSCGISKNELAEKLGTNTRHIRIYEQNNRIPAAKITSALEVYQIPPHLHQKFIDRFSDANAKNVETFAEREKDPNFIS